MKSKLIKIFLFSAIVSSCVFAASCNDECAHMNMSEAVIAPSHTEQGYTTYVCDDCRYTFNANFVAPLGHTLNKNVISPTCKSEGYTQNTCECGYTFKSDFLPPLPHTLKEEIIKPTCTAQGYTESTCECGYSFKSQYISPSMHSFKQIESVDATCVSEGYKVGKCEKCGFEHTYDVLSPLGHDLIVEREYVSLYDGLAESHYNCSRCELSYAGDFLFYSDVYHGAYVDNTEVLAKGIDVSRWNHNLDASSNYIPLDWKKIKDAGFSFVILKAGEMSSGNVFVPSPVFEMDYAGAKAAGLYVGAYIYSYAYTVEDAHAEAAAMISALKGKQFEYPIFFDIEYSDAKIAEKGLTPEKLTEICNEFISTMQKNGYFTALYTNNKWLTEYFVTSQVTSTFDIWYARYLYADKTIVVNEATWNAEKYGQQMAMWQFSETGTIDGITKNDGKGTLTSFDLNYCYKDYPTLIKEYGLNGFPREHTMSSNEKEI